MSFTLTLEPLTKFPIEITICCCCMECSGGFRGRPPTAQNFLNFMQFFAKFGKTICWHPPEGWRPLLRGILDPPLEWKVLCLNYTYPDLLKT